MQPPFSIDGVAEKKGGLFFQGGSSFFIKNKLKSEIFNDQKSLLTKIILFSLITQNLNWEILTKNLITFKRWHGVKDKKILILWEFTEKSNF